MYQLQKQDLAEAAKVFARAFEPDPLYRYFCPDLEKRLAFLEDFFLFRLRFAQKKGKLYADSPELNCIMGLGLPGVTMKPMDLILLGGLSALSRAGKETRNRVMAFNSFIDECEKAACPGPKYFLGPMATRPERQRQGLGSAMFTFMTSEICQGDAPQILDTQSLANTVIYGRQGFVLVGERVIPGTDLTNYTMIRK